MLVQTEQGKQMISYAQTAGKDELNQDRYENIDTIARKVSSKCMSWKPVITSAFLLM